MTAERPPSVPGLIRSSILFKEKVLLSPDILIGVLAGVGAWYFVPETQVKTALDGLTTAGLAIAATLVGVVIAALAVMVAFLSDEFLAKMDRATAKYGAMEGQLFPFWFVTGLGIVTILLSVGTIAFAQAADPVAQRVLVGLLTGLLVWTSLGVLNLVGYIHHTGVSRAIDARKKFPPPPER
jgi:hypothetical protein